MTQEELQSGRQRIPQDEVLLLRTSNSQDDTGHFRMKSLLLRMSGKPGWQKDAPQDVVIRMSSRIEESNK